MYRDIFVASYHDYTVILQSDYDSIPTTDEVSPFRRTFIVIDPDGMVLDPAESERLGRILTMRSVFNYRTSWPLRLSRTDLPLHLQSDTGIPTIG